ncbi:DEAD/DEAH box helicase [Serpentinicella sp. ANB-PHB4]|uniref:DEAD/DEAH box helicase n=1 Tax=Serpentinicella sp. ANB-PHB4 TaxID=3074076 RepID=UPI0028561ED5|nr:DEAD/DEAH box helicase [Serpentinicella sp. ANB-PHB4]MDR5659942.1 DEAD/DEAH box helicase [Serpentinicella sp. ANB-PHB4]
MFQIELDDLMALSSITGAYKKGLDYYRKKRVVGLSFDRKNNQFKARVKGGYYYDVKVTFDEKGEYIKGDCTCPAHDTYSGGCKHLVAVMMEIKEKDETGAFSKIHGARESRDLLAYFNGLKGRNRTNINLEITYERKKAYFRGDRDQSFISFRIGLDKLYVVKYMKEFMRYYESDESLYMGKSFTYEPDNHQFNRVDQKVIELVQEIDEMDEIVNEANYINHTKGLFTGKYVKLSDRMLKRFLNLMKDTGKKFNVIIDGHLLGYTYVSEAPLPISFSLDKGKKGIALDIDLNESVKPLVPDGSFLLMNRRIYKVPESQKEAILPFYSILDKQKSKRIEVPESDETWFMTGVYPKIKQAGEVDVSQGLEEKIYQPGLNSQVYLDQKDEQIIAKLLFNYGEITINPFASEQKEITDRILIRDLEKESSILNYFEENEFKVRDGEAYLGGDEHIFNLVKFGIKKLQGMSDVYYSDNFKNVEIKSSAVFSGGLQLNTKDDLLEFHFDVTGIEDTELKEVLKAMRRKKKYYRLRNGGFLPLDEQTFLETADLFSQLDLSEEDLQDNIISLPKYRALYLDKLIEEKALNFIEKNHAFKSFTENVRNFETVDYYPPESLKEILRSYQVKGFRWLKVLTNYGLGGILADDMGLGKTLQVLSFLLSEKQEKGNTKALIVAPTSLVYNWISEVEKFTPDLKAVAVAGNKAMRKDILDKIAHYDVVITSYPLIRRDIELYSSHDFDYCILDEAQHIKNYASKNAKSVKEIKARHKFALTGTPMENALSELWSIFDFVMPGYLSSNNKFKDHFEKPIVKDGDQKALADLSKLIGPFLLRRLKKEVLKELPEKTESKMLTELTSEQKKVYLAYLKEIKGELEEAIKEKGFERSQIKILAGLTRLRQICCHPGLFIENYKGGSGKMDLLSDLIEANIAGGHRTLLFSQFTSMLQLIKQKLDALNIEYFYLDGSTPMEKRGEMVNAFNEGQGQIFLISLKAGGTGLNLTGADTVIHFDPWWNPAVEEQATDRAYRIGQTSKVQVMKLITKGTIEEKIFNLQEKKKEMINAVIQPGETMLTKITSQELMEILSEIEMGA